METTMEESTSLEILPREIWSYCFSLLSPDYSYWDLWRVGLVNKIFFEQTNSIKDQFPKKIHIDPRKFKDSVLDILWTHSKLDQLKSKLKAHLQRYKFPDLTKQYRKECNMCRAPVTELICVEDTFESKSDDMRWAEEHITWCPEKHSLVRRSYRRIKGYYMWEYYDDTYRKHKLLTVDEAIEILISRRNAILKLNFGARERPTNEYEN